ncbi:MAG TPA: hypothetical protein VGD01_15465 [Candidatus Elarobacter sp.]|jgi:photosystem II stability/assembly factor-like uncharacterized protein
MRTGSALAAGAALAAILSCACVVAHAAPAGPATPAAPRKPGPNPAVSPSPRPDTEGVKFRAIGPAISGGRVPAVAGSDRDPALYYVGGAGGGVFKSTDGGTSFAPVWEGASKFGAIGAIAVAPSDDKTVWVGTGEANPRNDVSYGDGVWLTRDGAKHWTHAGLADTALISKILVDPKNPRRAIVAALGDPWKDSASRGVYVTNDGGRSWAKTLYAGPASGAADLAWNPSAPSTVFAAIWQFRREPWIASSGGPADGLYRSRDGGRTWSKLQGRGFPTDTLGRIGVAVAPSDPKRVYAVVQSKQGTVWRSDDGGDSWRRVSSDTRPEQRPFYFSHLAVDPKQRDRVIAVSMYLTVSKDGGRSWKHLTGNVHVDNHALWWSADGTRIIEGNDGGAILSRNGGDSWAFLDRIPLAQIYHVGFSDERPYLICGGLQDNSSWCAPATSRNGIGLLNRDWFAIAGGDGMYAVPDPVDPNFIWTNTQDGVLGIYDRKARQSVDVSPYPRDLFTSLTSLAESPYRFNWNAPLAFAPQDGHVVYFGGNVVFKTTDRGRHWTPISPDLTRNEKAHQRASGGPVMLDVSGAENYDTTLALAPSPKDASVIWAGTDDGLVQLTRDGGAHWTNVTPAGWPRYGRVAVIEASPHAAGSAFTLLDRHDLGDRRPYVFVTDDFGASWRSIASNLPLDAPVRVVRQDLREPNLLYAGTENALWISYDRGGRWEPLRAGLPAVPVYDVHVHPSANDLLVATHGRGFYVLDDLAALQQLAAARRAGVQLFPVRDATLWAGWPSIETGDAASLPANVFSAPNAPAGAVMTFYQRTKAQQRPWFEIVDANGKVVRTLRGRVPYDPSDPPKDERARWYVSNDAGLNRVTWDGNEDAPTRWRWTSFGNGGPSSGPEALPGRYTARLHLDGKTYEQPFALADDPQSPFTAEQRVARHAYLATAYRCVDVINRALNEIGARLKQHPAPAGRDALTALRDELTSDARYDEDSVAKPDRLRERVLTLTYPLSGNLQPPFEQHQATLDALKLDFAKAYTRIAGVLGAQFAESLGVQHLDTKTTPSGAIITAPKPSPTASP